jgi:hypothetical protein
LSIKVAAFLSLALRIPSALQLAVVNADLDLVEESLPTVTAVFLAVVKWNLVQTRLSEDMVSALARQAFVATSRGMQHCRNTTVNVSWHLVPTMQNGLQILLHVCASLGT